MTIGDWVTHHRPEVPAEFRTFLDSDEEPSPDGFMSAAKHALAQALELEARDRDAAFALLAADAHVTFSCSALVQEDKGSDELKGLAVELVREFL